MLHSIPRRRSAPHIAGRDKDDSDNDDRPPVPKGGRSERLPFWQVATLSLGTFAVLMVVMSYTAPFHVHKHSTSTSTTGAAGPKCYPLSDTERVKLLGSQNKAVRRRIVTESKSAQTLFDLGLLHAWGFERSEAIGNFQAALRYDPHCAMCFWGLAYAAGPYPNVVPGKVGEVYPVFNSHAAQEAESHAVMAVRMANQAVRGGEDGDLIRREIELTNLMAKRFAGASKAVQGSGEMWYAQEREFAEAMTDLAERSVNDPDIFALAAEAFLNLRPWDYYTELGNLRPDAARAEELLRRALALHSRHALALHLHIHVAEAGAPTLDGAKGDTAVWAGRALGSADALAASGVQQGHLLHMPSHIYVRVGLFHQAVAANQRAYDFDTAGSSHCLVPYLPEHNINLLIYAASMGGKMHTAESYARGVRSLRERVSDKWMAKGSEWTSLPLLLARYGEWSKVLQLSAPPRDARGVTYTGGAQYTQVVYRYVRVLAMAAKAEAYTNRALGIDDKVAYDLAAKGAEARQEDVHKEMKLLRTAIAAVPREPHTKPGHGVGMYASSYHALARIHGAVAEARLAMLLNQTAQALDQLDEAVGLEERLGYMEPPRLHQPVRQCLGWVLLQAGKVAEATDAFHKDLLRHPNNGWALMGLWQVAKAAGNSDEIDKAQQQFRAAWTDAEVQISSSCPALSSKFKL